MECTGFLTRECLFWSCGLQQGYVSDSTGNVPVRGTIGFAQRSPISAPRCGKVIGLFFLRHTADPLLAARVQIANPNPLGIRDCECGGKFVTTTKG
jgi:hypothetical protein